MASRKAIGATLASTIIFSTLVLASQGLQYSAEGLADNHLVGEEENRLVSMAMVLRGVTETELLAQTASVIASRAYDCANATSELYGSIVGLTAAAGDYDISVFSKIVPLEGASGTADPVVKPFDQLGSGRLTLSMHSSINGSALGGRVNYTLSASSVTALDLNPSSLSALCEDALRKIMTNLGITITSRCDPMDIGISVNRTLGDPLAEVAGGPAIYASTQLLGVYPCQVKVNVLVSQSDIPYPGGSITFTARGDELVSG